MTTRRMCRKFSGRAVSVLCLAALASGCTLFDDWPNGGLPGTPFTPRQPEGAVTLVGEMNDDAIARASENCAPGNTVFWGLVRNTGDVDVTDVAITIDVFNGAGGRLGSWRGTVYNGDVDDSNPDFPRPGTALAVDQSGTFEVCTGVPYGAAARTDYHTSFAIVDVLK